jgi:PAS domain
VSDYIPPAAIRSTLVHGLYAHWEAKRAGRLGPRWREIDPGAIRPLLPFISMSDVIESPFDLRYRLVGTGVADAAGRDFTGSRLSALIVTTGFDSWLAHYMRVAHQARPFYGRYRGDIAPELARYADHGAFPLSETGERVDGILEIEDWSEIRGLNPSHIELPVWRFETLPVLVSEP